MRIKFIASIIIISAVSYSISELFLDLITKKDIICRYSYFLYVDIFTIITNFTAVILLNKKYLGKINFINIIKIFFISYVIILVTSLLLTFVFGEGGDLVKMFPLFRYGYLE